MRDERWWKEVAKLLDPRGKVNFPIDGLEDTNLIYLVNLNWNRIVLRKHLMMLAEDLLGLLSV